MQKEIRSKVRWKRGALALAVTLTLSLTFNVEQFRTINEAEETETVLVVKSFVVPVERKEDGSLVMLEPVPIFPGEDVDSTAVDSSQKYINIPIWPGKTAKFPAPKRD